MNRSTLLAALMLGVAAPAAAQTVATAEVIVVPSNPAPSVPGSFDRLSAGQQKIGRALFESQVVRPDGPAPLSLDQIATMRSAGGTDTGWGQVFKDMQSQGLVEAKNLGQVVSGARHAGGPTAAASAAGTRTTIVTVTNGRGQTITTGRSARAGRSTVSDGTTTSTTTAHGHGSVSRSSVITTGRGRATTTVASTVSHGGNAGGIVTGKGVGHGGGNGVGGGKK